MQALRSSPKEKVVKIYVDGKYEEGVAAWYIDECGTLDLLSANDVTMSSVNARDWHRVDRILEPDLGETCETYRPHIDVPEPEQAAGQSDNLLRGLYDS